MAVGLLGIDVRRCAYRALILPALRDSQCVDPVAELPGMDQRPQDVVVQISEPQCNPAQVLQPPIDGFDGPVRRSDMEIRQDIGPTAPQRAPELRLLLQPLRESFTQRVDQSGHQLLAP